MKRIPAFIALAFASLAAFAQMPQGLVLRFSCDEFKGGGISLPDMTGSNNNGRAMGVKWAAGGRLGAACEFSGWNSSVQVTNNPMLSSKQTTVCAWFKTDKVEGADRMLFDKLPATGYALSLLGGNKGAKKGRLCFTVCGHDCLSDTNLADNVWHHVTAVYDGENLKLYVGGQLQKQVTAWRGEIPANGQDLTIGMNRSCPAPKEKQIAYEGMLDEVAVFNRALSADDIKNVLASTQPKFTKQQVERRLAELKELLDRGLILQNFYDRKVKECEVTP
jgi:hypothetical protein